MPSNHTRRSREGWRGEEEVHGSLRLPVPRELSRFFAETFRLAEALVGVDCSHDAKLEAVLAESGDEVDITVGAEEAIARLADKMPLRKPRRKQKVSSSLAAMQLGTLGDAAVAILGQLQGAKVPRGGRGAAAMRPSGGASSRENSPEYAEASSGENSPEYAELLRALTIGEIPTNKRQRARFLHRALRRTQRTDRRLTIKMEDTLLELCEDDAPGKLGFRNFRDFADVQLGLAPSTAYECLKRARARRRNDPVAVAYALGRIGQVQTYLLFRLYHKGVPRSCMEAWIREAQTLTVQALRDRVEWVCQQVDRDYRSWLLANCPPPTDERVRMSKRSLREIAKNPNPETFDRLFEHRRIPMTTLVWSISSHNAVHLQRMIASVQDQLYAEHNVLVEPWIAALLIFHRARVAWSHLPQSRSKWEPVYDRDEYRCSVPSCSLRRGLHDHHIVFRSHQGGDEHVNQITICIVHHRMAHEEKIIRITGISEHGKDSLLFEMGLDDNGENPHEVYLGDRKIAGEEV